MARITHVSIPHQDKQYTLSLDWDDKAFVNEASLAFKIRAEVEEPGRDPQPVELDIQFYRDEQGAGWIKVVHKDASIFEAPISELVGLDSSVVVAEIIDKIPVQFVDPILGCAIRAALASIVEQAIKCARSIEAEGFAAATRQFLECMGGNIAQIGKWTALRFIRCFILI